LNGRYIATVVNRAITLSAVDARAVFRAFLVDRGRAAAACCASATILPREFAICVKSDTRRACACFPTGRQSGCAYALSAARDTFFSDTFLQTSLAAMRGVGLSDVDEEAKNFREA
jgi:hypothetical protein